MIDGAGCSQEAGQVVAAAAAKGASLAPDHASRAFWCALGHLYSAARTEVMRLGHDAGLRPDASDSLLLQNVRDAPLLCRKSGMHICPQLRPDFEYL